jgi:ribosomal protein S18 acetylase RimI-like enzyme
MIVGIREYDDKDRASVISLWEESFHLPDFHNDPGISIDMKTKHNDGLIFIATDEQQLIGTIIAGFDGHRGWIYSLAVKKQYRNKGVGSLLLKKALEELKKRGCLKVNLQVEGDNSEIVPFYEKNGFKVEDRISMGLKLY